IANEHFITSEGLRFAAEALKLMQTRDNEIELATLLSVRAMNTEYSPAADAALSAAANLNFFTTHILSGHSAEVWGVAFSPDDKYIVTASVDKTARLWDAQTGTFIREFVGHTDTLYDVAYSPDGKTILTGSGDKTARLWDVQTGKEIRQFI